MEVEEIGWLLAPEDVELLSVIRREDIGGARSLSIVLSESQFVTSHDSLAQEISAKLEHKGRDELLIGAHGLLVRYLEQESQESWH